MRSHTMVGALIGLTLAGVWYDSVRARPVAHLPSLLEPASKGDSPVRAVLVIQRADCTGNLRLFDLVRPNANQPSPVLQAVWYVGDARDTSVIRRAMPSWARTTRLEPAKPEALRTLRRLGHESTPMILVTDQAGRIRLVSQSPRSPREFAGLRRITQSLTWFEEL